MKWVFRKNLLNRRKLVNGFTLVEVTAALIILGMITATVLVVANRAIDTVVLWQTKMEAFEIARENMEKILAGSAVTDMVEYGTSERNPDINWETTVESFYEPITENMWIRAICSAGFIDAGGQEQKVEFTHWIASLNQKQIERILEQKLREEAYYMAMTEAEAADESLQEADQQTDQQQQVDQEPQVETDSQTEQERQDTDAQSWKDIEKLIGSPPEGYEHWGQVPKDEFWKVLMERLFKK
jgi:prepilin-type N-terminal cleavage/methylation domain-containing protein